MMFSRWGRVVVKIRWLILAGAVALVAVGAGWGSGVFNSLVNGGFTNPGSPSAQAEAQITARLGDLSPDLLILYSSPTATVSNPAFRTSVTETATALRKRPGVASVITYYDTGSATLVSKDRHATYAVVRLTAPDQNGKTKAYQALGTAMDAPGLTTQVGGTVALDNTVDTMSKSDVGKGEKVALPIVLVLLIFIFGGLTAAAMPLLMGGLAILGALTATRLISNATDVSTFAVNSITLLGLGMGIDYSLLMVNRFREELRSGYSSAQAVARTVATAGRTVFVSSLTVALALASLLIFPEVFLRSMAYGGMAAVLVAMIASVTVLPALLSVLGTKINTLRIPLPRRRSGRREKAATDSGAWAALARSVMRRPVPYIIAVLAVVTVLTLPFFSVHFGGTDERVLPPGTQARVVAEDVAADFPGTATAPIQTLVEGASPAQVQTLTSQITAIGGVTRAQVTAHRGDATLISVNYAGPQDGNQAYSAVREIRALSHPAGVSVQVGGASADDVDLMASIGHLLPWMAAIIAAVTLVLLFAAFGSVTLAVTSVLMNLVSLAAAFGAVVWVFQDGHLAGLLGFTPTGQLQPNIMILILAVLFGLGTDYEVFLLSRIREAWDVSGDNTGAVAAGLQRTGRIITAAALLLIAVAAGFTTGQVAITKTIGVGMIVALIVDAALVRTLLVPALMRVLGRWNWWAPGPLGRVYHRYGIAEPTEGPPAPAARHAEALTE